MQELAPITTAASAATMLHDRMNNLDHEEVWVIYLTSRVTPLGTEMLSKGTLTETTIDCRTVIRQVLLKNAAAIILLHNHPSGDPTPSASDIRFTDRLRKACSLMDIKFLDHIITSENAFYSFAEETTTKY